MKHSHHVSTDRREPYCLWMRATQAFKGHPYVPNASNWIRKRGARSAVALVRSDWLTSV